MISKTPELQLHQNLVKILFLFVMICTVPAQISRAQIQFNQDELEQGQVILTFSVTEQQLVKQNRLNISVQYSLQGEDSINIQQELNDAMNKIMPLLEKHSESSYFIDQYHVYRLPGARQGMENAPATQLWRAQQSIHLQSENYAALLELIAELQQAGFIISNQYYSLSSGKREEISSSLLETGLSRLTNRAQETARILGKSDVVLLEINLSPSQSGAFTRGPIMMADAAMNAASYSAPVAAAGEETVSFTISAKALLLP